jgi:hypothetical protein
LFLDRKREGFVGKRKIQSSIQRICKGKYNPVLKEYAKENNSASKCVLKHTRELSRFLAIKERVLI